MRTRTLSVLAIALATSLRAQTPRPPLWLSANGGQIPQGAIAYGRGSDGREQFVCRGAYSGGTQIGRIVSGSGGCSIGYAGREIVLGAYEVLTEGAMLRNPAVAILRSRPTATVAETRGGTQRIAGQLSIAPLAVTALSVRGTITRHFDENGKPYVEETLPDGTIRKTSESSVDEIKPDGTKTHTPVFRTFSDTQLPTPPELPQDGKRGRYWMEHHNEDLLTLIGILVNNNEGDMNKFVAAEQKNTSNVFEQIAWRTEVAGFLAKQR